MAKRSIKVGDCVKMREPHASRLTYGTHETYLVMRQEPGVLYVEGPVRYHPKLRRHRGYGATLMYRVACPRDTKPRSKQESLLGSRRRK